MLIHKNNKKIEFVSFCSPLMANDVDCVYVCVSHPFMFYCLNSLISSMPQFQIGLFVFLMFTFVVAALYIL